MAQRGRLKRAWVKLDCNGIIHGSINWQLTLEEQAVWIKAFAYSAVCGGEPGIIQDNDGQALPHQFIAEEFHCPIEVFESMLEKCKTQSRLEENSDGIKVINFKAYQFTEYDRQKPYRQGKGHHELTEEEKDDNRYQLILGTKYLHFRQEHHRQPTPKEEKVIQASADREFGKNE